MGIYAAGSSVEGIAGTAGASAAGVSSAGVSGAVGITGAGVVMGASDAGGLTGC